MGRIHIEHVLKLRITLPGKVLYFYKLFLKLSNCDVLKDFELILDKVALSASKPNRQSMPILGLEIKHFNRVDSFTTLDDFIMEMRTS